MPDFTLPDEGPDTAATPARLRIRLLGEMEVRDGLGRPLVLRVRKTRALLAILALGAPRPVLRQHIAGLLWSTRGAEQARASLRQAVHDLSDHLGPLGGDLLRPERAHLALAGEDVRIDVHEVARASLARPEPLDLLSEPLLVDLVGLDPAFDRWRDSERLRLLRAGRNVAEAALAAIGPPEAAPQATIIAATRLLALDRAHEPGWRALISAHAAAGDRARALEAFEAACSALAELAGASPSTETLALGTAIRHPAGRVRAPASAVPRALARLAEPGVRLGVMPLRDLGSGEETGGDSFSLGLAEEITNALARFRYIFLLSSSSLAHLVGQPYRPGEPWDALDLDFLLDGSVQRGGRAMRITVRLLDLRAGGEVVWASRFDREAVNLMELQDEIAAAIVAQVDPELLLREGSRAATRPLVDPTAHDLLMQAIPPIYRLEREGFMAAGDKLAAAAALQPDHPGVNAWWAFWHVFLVGEGWAEDPGAALARAEDLARRAVTLDPTDARALALVGHVRAFLHKRVSEAMALHERALSLNPNLPLAWLFSGLAHAYAGDPDEAIRRIDRARRLSPFDPHSFFFDMAQMLAHLLRREFDAAGVIGRRAMGLNPGFTSTHKVQLSALGHLGRVAEAADIRRRLLRLEPGFTIRTALERAPFTRHEDADLYADGLRLAGLTE